MKEEANYFFPSSFCYAYSVRVHHDDRYCQACHHNQNNILRRGGVVLGVVWPRSGVYGHSLLSVPSAAACQVRVSDEIERVVLDITTDESNSSFFCWIDLKCRKNLSLWEALNYDTLNYIHFSPSKCCSSRYLLGSSFSNPSRTLVTSQSVIYIKLLVATQSITMCSTKASSPTFECSSQITRRKG